MVVWFFILIFDALYKQGQKTHATRPLAVALFAISMLAVFGDACFSFPKEQPAPTAYMFCICGLIVAYQQATTRTIRPILSRLLLIGLFALSSLATVLVWHQIRFDMHYLNALIAEKDNDWNAVMDEVEKGLSYGSFRSHMWIIKGRAKERQGQYNEAEAAYLQALSRAPYSWHAHNGLGIIYKRQEKFDLSLEHYNKALSYFPGENNYSAIQIRTNLGALYASMGKTQLAEQEYRAILQIDPRDPGANNNMGNLFKAHGQLDSAEVAYLVALRSDSTLIQAHFNLSDLYIKKGRLTDALSHAQKAAKLQPDNARIHWNLGRIQEANRQLKEALKAYQQAIDTDPSFAQPYFNIGNLLFDTKQYAEAQHAYHNFVAKWTGDASYVEFANNRILLCQDYYRRQEAWRTKKAETP
jgi:tetratricopeptide (TPR) repeat protein